MATVKGKTSRWPYSFVTAGIGLIVGVSDIARIGAAGDIAGLVVGKGDDASVWASQRRHLIVFVVAVGGARRREYLTQSRTARDIDSRRDRK